MGSALRQFRIKIALIGVARYQIEASALNMQKTLRVLAVSLALVALVVFATGVVSDWNHNSPKDDARCPYCQLGHQTPSHLEAAPAVCLLRPVASLPLPEDFAPAAGPAFSQTAPRAPPA